MSRNKITIENCAENSDDQKNCQVNHKSSNELIKDNPINEPITKNLQSYEQMKLIQDLNWQDERNNDTGLNLNKALYQGYMPEQKLIIKTKPSNYIDIEEVKKMLGIDNNQNNSDSLSEIESLKQFFLSRRDISQNDNELLNLSSRYVLKQETELPLSVPSVELQSHYGDFPNNLSKNTQTFISHELQNNEKLNKDTKEEESLENYEKCNNLLNKSILETQKADSEQNNKNNDFEDDIFDDLEKEDNSMSDFHKNEQLDIDIEEEVKNAKDIDESWTKLFMKDIKSFQATSQMKKLYHLPTENGKNLNKKKVKKIKKPANTKKIRKNQEINQTQQNGEIIIAHQMEIPNKELSIPEECPNQFINIQNCNQPQFELNNTNDKDKYEMNNCDIEMYDLHKEKNLSERKNKNMTEFLEKHNNEDQLRLIEKIQIQTDTLIESKTQSVKQFSKNFDTNTICNHGPPEKDFETPDFKKIIEKSINLEDSSSKIDFCENNDPTKILEFDYLSKSQIFSIKRFKKKLDTEILENINFPPSKAQELLDDNTKDKETFNAVIIQTKENMCEKQFKSQNKLKTKTTNKMKEKANLMAKDKIIFIGDIKNNHSKNKQLQGRNIEEAIQIPEDEDFCILIDNKRNYNTIVNNQIQEPLVKIPGGQLKSKIYNKSFAKKMENNPKFENLKKKSVTPYSNNFYDPSINPRFNLSKSDKPNPFKINTRFSPPNLMDPIFNIFPMKTLPCNALPLKPILNQNLSDIESLTGQCVQNSIHLIENFTNSAHQSQFGLMVVGNSLPFTPIASNNNKENNNMVLNFNQVYSDSKKLEIHVTPSISMENLKESNLTRTQKNSYFNEENSNIGAPLMSNYHDQIISSKEFFIPSKISTNPNKLKSQNISDQNTDSLINKPFQSQQHNEINSNLSKYVNNIQFKPFNPFLNPALQKNTFDLSMLDSSTKIIEQNSSFITISDDSLNDVMEIKSKMTNEKGIKLNLPNINNSSMISKLFLKKNNTDITKSVFGFMINNKNSKI